MSVLVYVLHIAGGTVGVVSGALAASAPKGGRLHRLAGRVFLASMLVMAAFAAWLGLVVPGQLVNVFIAIFASYLVLTGWMTAWRRVGTAGLAEKFALAVSLTLCAPFVLLSFQVTFGLPTFIASATPLKGPVLVAIYTFTGVFVLAAAGDARLVWRGGLQGTARTARHLWRMLFGLALATGSAFTNGLSRLLPGPFHVPPAFFLPQFLPLALIAFWMWRLYAGKRWRAEHA